MTRDEEGPQKPPAEKDGEASPKPLADDARSGEIDANLRRVYREMVEEEVPDRFQRLIQQLREQDDRP